MSPGINDHPRNTGTLPKSNRRSDRNRERDRSTFNQNIQWFSRTHQTPAQHANNLFQLDWHPVSERPTTTTTTTAVRTAKNSNTRSTFTATPAPSFFSCDLGDLGSYNSHSRLYPNIYAREDLTSWLKMSPPMDSPTQSPLNLPTKTTNTDKMPERAQVEGRLNQIREYIKVTSTMMDSLSQSNDPRAQAQHEKLGRMMDDLYDSEQKLSKLMEECQKYWIKENGDLENGIDRNRELELRKKIEESQRKLAQLQEHQAQLVGMQLSVRERLNEARQAQRALLAGEPDNENDVDEDEEDEEEVQQQGTDSKVEQLERETEALRDKLQQLESKKRHMDHIVQELQNAELMERSSCSSELSRVADQRDKVAELEAMKAQLAHLKALMVETTRAGEVAPPGSELEHNDDTIQNSEQPVSEDVYHIVYNGTSNYSNSLHGADETPKQKRSSNLPTVEQIQAVTRELKEHHQQLQATRAELQRLKQGQLPTIMNPAPSLTSSTPPPALAEKKQSNNDTRQAQNKCRQLKDYIRKDQIRGLSITQNGRQEWGSHRGSNSQHSHASNSGNLWPLNSNQVRESHEPNIDSISTAENPLENGSQTLIENGFGNNFWGMPSVLTNQPPQGAVVGSAEYYKQLLLGSQAQQLQMMSTTIQQCCQLLWSQQRDMQSMRSTITQLQAQVRHLQSRTSNNLDLHEDHHSNLGRAATQQEQHFSSLDAATLPPSSSLPNLVSLPSSSPAPPPSVISTSANCQQQQLNNQVPPGNRANNYWDNFRSYSRQNLLSGSSKTVTDCIAGASAHISSSNTSNGVISAHLNKCNRPNGQENLSIPPSMSGSMDTQYSLNLQTQSNSHHHLQQPNQQHQQHNRESTSVSRNNYLTTSDGSSQQQIQHQEQPENVNNQSIQPGHNDARISKKIREREVLKLILTHCKKALQIRSQNESPVQSSNISNRSDSSEDEYEIGYQMNATTINNGNVSSENQVTALDVLESISSVQEMGFYENATNVITFASPSASCNNENLIEADQMKPELLKSCSNDENTRENELEVLCADGVVTASVSEDQSSTFEASELSQDELNAEDEQVRAEYVMLDRLLNSPTSQQRHRRSENRVPASSLSPRIDQWQK